MDIARVAQQVAGLTVTKEFDGSPIEFSPFFGYYHTPDPEDVAADNQRGWRHNEYCYQVAHPSTRGTCR